MSSLATLFSLTRRGAHKGWQAQRHPPHLENGETEANGKEGEEGEGLVVGGLPLGGGMKAEFPDVLLLPSSPPPTDPLLLSLLKGAERTAPPRRECNCPSPHRYLAAAAGSGLAATGSTRSPPAAGHHTGH